VTNRELIQQYAAAVRTGNHGRVAQLGEQLEGRMARWDAPRYLMREGEQQVLLLIEQAGALYSSLWTDVAIAGLVVEPDGRTVRAITDEERRRIRDIADAHAASK